MNRRAQKSGSYIEVRTFAVLFAASEWAVEQAEGCPKEVQQFPCIHAIVSSIHCVEAFLNHVGPQYFDRWDEKDSELRSIKAKLNALLTKFAIPRETIIMEYASLMLGFRIRNDLAHGRTAEVSAGAKKKYRAGSNVTQVPPEWYRHRDPKTARRVFEAARFFIELIGESAGEGKLCWGIQSSGFFLPETPTVATK